MEKRIWTQVAVKVSPEMEDPVSDFLTTLTGRGIRIREEGGQSVIDAFLQPGEIEDSLLRIEKHLEDLVQMGLHDGLSRQEVKELPEEDWMAVFRAQHTAVRVSDRLVVRPTWCEPTGEREIVIDPGMAFGTGSHATTRMCLALLDKCLGDRVPGRMFDLGTGSGILAIAGAHLGIGDILAVDIDAMAVDVATRNVMGNDADARVRVEEGGIEAARGPYDLITANISASLLKRMAADITRHLGPGGCVILSGILEDEEAEVLGEFIRCGLKVEQVMKDKVWVAALLIKQ